MGMIKVYLSGAISGKDKADYELQFARGKK